jgi:hypothetical protein
MNALSLRFLSIRNQCQKSKNIVETEKREGKGRHANTMILEVSARKPRLVEYKINYFGISGKLTCDFDP